MERQQKHRESVLFQGSTIKFHSFRFYSTTSGRVACGYINLVWRGCSHWAKLYWISFGRITEAYKYVPTLKKAQRTAHTAGTNSYVRTYGQRFLNIGSRRLRMPANIMLCHRNPDGYSDSFLFRWEMCLWAGVCADVIIWSYINLARKSDFGSAMMNSVWGPVTQCQWKLLDIGF